MTDLHTVGPCTRPADQLLRGGFRKSRWWPAPLVVLAAVLLVPGTAAAEEETLLGQPGYLIVSAALDSTDAFHWQMGPGPGRRSLTWAEGILVLPDSMAVESMRGVDLAVPCRSDLAGIGATGQLAWRDGIFPVSEPLLLTDGRVQLYVTAGELEINGGRIRYRVPTVAGRNPMAGYVFLVGMVVLIVVLLRRAAIKGKARR